MTPSMIGYLNSAVKIWIFWSLLIRGHHGHMVWNTIPLANTTVSHIVCYKVYFRSINMMKLDDLLLTPSVIERRFEFQSRRVYNIIQINNFYVIFYLSVFICAGRNLAWGRPLLVNFTWYEGLTPQAQSSEFCTIRKLKNVPWRDNCAWGVKIITGFLKMHRRWWPWHEKSDSWMA